MLAQSHIPHFYVCARPPCVESKLHCSWHGWVYSHWHWFSWGTSTSLAPAARERPSGKFLEDVRDNTDARWTNWGDSVLHALLKNKEELVRAVIVNRNHDCNDPDTEELKILGELGRRVALDLMKESCGLFREEAGGRQLLWEPIMKGKDVQKA